MNKAIHILCLSDGKPGHYNQTKGLIQVFEARGDVSVEWVEVELKLKFFRFFLKFIVNINVPFLKKIIPIFYRNFSYDVCPDYIFSAGGNTLYLNACLGYICDAKNFFIGSLRGVRSVNFYRVVSIEPLGCSNNIVLPLAPVFIDKTECFEKIENRWCLLIGGNTKDYQYSDREWKLIVDKIKVLTNKNNLNWVITTSRRTGSKVEKIFKESGLDSKSYELTLYSENPSPVVSRYLQTSSVILCTEDSMSMLTEAIYTGKPVISLVPEKIKVNENYEKSIIRLENEGWLLRLFITDLDDNDDFYSYLYSHRDVSPFESISFFFKDFK